MTHRAARRPSDGRAPWLAALWLAACAGFIALGLWQVQRRAWKLDLIARVQARLHAAPVDAPGPALWPHVDDAHDAYRRVRVRGVFRDDRQARVQALTEQGGGFWVMTPLRTDRGFTVLVNRGFVPPDRSAPQTQAVGEHAASVTGLLRISEPHGGFLRTNAPAQGRWYSRDVAAIAKAQGLGVVAPYFIDADATPNPGGWPMGGLTVVRFPNSHLIYAVTWFTLASMAAGGAAWTLYGARPGAGGVP